MNLAIERSIGEEAVFRSPSEVDESLAELSQGFREIRRECLAYLELGERIPGYHDLDPIQKSISTRLSPTRRWKVIPLEVFGRRPVALASAFERTYARLDRVPRRLQVLVSILEAEKSVPAHEGPFKGYLRYHLGLVAEDPETRFLRVADERRHWREGEAFVFDDSLEHEVVNASPSERIVLMVDVARDRPAWVARLVASLRPIASWSYGRKVLQRFEAHRRA